MTTAATTAATPSNHQGGRPTETGDPASGRPEETATAASSGFRTAPLVTASRYRSVTRP